MRCTFVYTTPPTGHAPSTTWYCGPARSSTHGRSASPGHGPGTGKMGPDADPMAVVDQYCRVKGVQGLWVVDASVMPRIPRSGGAHATVVMIGERVVDWIAGRVPVSNG